MESKLYELTIIGGGPTGLFGLFYACLRQMDALIVDSLPELGGQLVALYPEKDVYDVAGFPRISAKELAAQMVEQALMHKKQDVLLNERVEHFERDEEQNIIKLTTTKGTVIHTRTVVIATGPGAFKPNRLPLQGLDGLEDKSLFYFVKDKTIFAGKRVIIVGGGDSAMDWVLALAPLAKEICLVHRRDAFRAHEDTVQKVMNLTDVKKHLFYEVKAVNATAEGDLQSVHIESSKGFPPLDIEADALLVNIGFAATAQPFDQWGLDYHGHHIHVNQRMETAVPGVFAAGDIVTYPGKLKLIATGVSEAAIAVNVAKSYIDPSQRVQPIHSSTLFEKK